MHRTPHAQDGTNMISSTSMTAPLTQNTAPIVEHRCLYTHDLRRKAKRWQDGILRFHTFNKRVMVYDYPARNYIGDTHWRQKTPVQDGDELELDRPVLVQVCDQIASLEQDLTELLEKRKKKHEVDEQPSSTRTSSYTQPMSIVSSPNATSGLSPLQPKSLNVLLGKGGNRLGKAMLPTKSPYELLKAKGNVEVHERRPSKRPRLDDSLIQEQRPAANSHPQGKQRVGIAREQINQAHQEDFRNAISSSQTRHRVQSERSELCEAEHTSLEPYSPSANAQGHRRQIDNQKRRRTKSKGRSQSEKLAVDLVQGQKDNDVRRPINSLLVGHVSQDPEHLSQPNPPNQDGLHSSNALATHAPQSPVSHQKLRSKLRLASSKPRRKLMYKDLLLEEVQTSSRRDAPTRERNAILLSDPSLIEDSGEVRSSSPRAEVTHAEPVISTNCPESPNLQAGCEDDCYVSQATDSAFADITCFNDLQPEDDILVRRGSSHEDDSPPADLIQQFTNECIEEHRGLVSCPSSMSRLAEQQDLEARDSDVVCGTLARAVSPPRQSEAHVDTGMIQKNIGDPNSPPSLQISDVAKCAAPQDRDAEISSHNARISPEPMPQLTDTAAKDCQMDRSSRTSLVLAGSKTSGPRTAGTSSLKRPPSLRTATSLPDFVPVRPERRLRSTLKASMSESAMSVASATTKDDVSAPAVRPSRAPPVEPWGRDAWDLFGCGKDGVAVDYGEFCRKEAIN